PAHSPPFSPPRPPPHSIDSSHLSTPNFAPSPDTPAKSPPDDTSYSAPSGGVLATLTTQVVGNQQGQPSLFLNLDDGSPNSPGSGIAFFDGTTSQPLNLSSSQLGDGYHGKGTTSVPLDCVTQECPPLVGSPTPTATLTASPTATPTATPTPTPTATPPPTPTPPP